MLATLGILCALIWIPILIYQMNRRGFLVLIGWLFIAPVASNLVTHPGANPFFKTELVQRGPSERVIAYVDLETTITLRELLQPTRLLLAVFVLLFLLELCVRRNRLFPLDRTEFWMSLFALILVCSALQSHRAAYGIRIAMDAFIVPFLGYFIARRFVTTEKELHKLVHMIGYMGCYLIALGMVEYVVNRMGLDRLQGPFRSTDLLYIVMSTVFFMIVLERVGPEKHLHRFPWLIRYLVTYSAPVIIFLTWSRGNWLGFLFALSVFVFLIRRSIRFGRKLAASGVTALIIVMSITVIPLLSMEELFGERISSAGNAYGRLATWQVGLKGVMEHPIFGIGLNDSRILLGENQIRMDDDIRSYGSLHNSLLSILVELGTIGLLAYLAIVASIARMGLNLYSKAQHVSEEWRGAALIALMVAQQIAPLFSLALYIPHMAQVYLYVCIGAIAGLYSPHRIVSHLSRFSSGRQPVSARDASYTA
jgi:O-antigen ligase